MTAIGNFFLILAGLIYLLMSPMLFSRRPPPSGDYGVGHAWTLLIGNALITLCLATATAIIAWKGGFSWVAGPGAPRFVIVATAVVLVMLAYNFFSMKEGTGRLPTALRYVVVYYLPG